MHQSTHEKYDTFVSKGVGDIFDRATLSEIKLIVNKTHFTNLK